jgi:hypothetical protein
MSTSTEETIDLRLPLKKDDPVYQDYLAIKESTGIKSNSEVLRFIIKVTATMNFSELLSKLNREKKTQETQTVST